ncbi:MAG: hypothetical protein GY869_02205 [Planctomycetes bacterium]|nr:hypothetical protein [Planctomycetota bacterium]
MDQKQMMIFGIVCLVICAVCLFVAVERYNTNANNVKAMNSMTQNSPLGGMMGSGEMKAVMPAATKYAILLAVVFGVGGAVLVVKSKKLTEGGS